MSGMNIKSWERSELFRLSGPDITSKHSRSLDINNYNIRYKEEFCILINLKNITSYFFYRIA